MSAENKVTAIIAAAGSGTRMGKKHNKLFCQLCGRTVLEWSIQAFERCKQINDIIIAANEADLLEMLDIVKARGFKKVKKIVKGGATRSDSVKAALAEAEDADTILIHDGARALVTDDIIKNTIQASHETGAAVAGVRVIDTIKTEDGQGFISQTPDRKMLWQIQTPQVFDSKLIKKAYENATEGATDDAALVESIGVRVKISEGSYYNIKITVPQDLIIAEALLESR